MAEDITGSTVPRRQLGRDLRKLRKGSRLTVLTAAAAHLRPDGALVTGFATGRAYSLAEFDAEAVAVGLEREHRFATWDLRRWHPDAGWAVTVLRRRR